MIPGRFLISVRWRQLRRGAYVAACLSVAALVGCGGEPLPPEPEPEPKPGPKISVGRWVQESGVPAQGILYDVWASSASDLWVAGEGGTVLRYDGSSWLTVMTGTIAPFFAITGTSASDVWAGGYDLLHYANGVRSKVDWIPPARPFTWWINDIWAASPSEAWAVSGYFDGYPRSNSSIHYFNGTKWSEAPFSGQSSGRDLAGVWGSSRSSVWVVGSERVLQGGPPWQGKIWHYNGTAWSSVPIPQSGILYGIWGSSSSDVWAVGGDGTILHYDGSNWSKVPSGTNAWLRDVWGASASNVWIVGDGGTILRYDGRSWVKMESGTVQNLQGIWGTSASSVWVVGGGGTVLRRVP